MIVPPDLFAMLEWKGIVGSIEELAVSSSN